MEIHPTEARPGRGRGFLMLSLLAAAGCGAKTTGTATLGGPSAAPSPGACADILRAAPATPGRPTTVVLAVGTDHARAIDALAGQGGNLVVARATANATVDQVASVDLDVKKQTPIERQKAASVARCVAVRLQASTSAAGDPIAGMGWATAQAAGTAGGQAARVVVLGAGDAVVSGIDLAKADLSTTALREGAARKVADAYHQSLRPVRNVDVMLVQPGGRAANGLSGENVSEFYDLLGQRTMRWRIVPATPLSFVAKSA